MSLLDALSVGELFGGELREAVNPIHPRDPALASMFGLGNVTPAGANVNEFTAMQQTTVWSCVGLVAETIASLPLILYRRTGAGKERATDHPLYPILHDEPNAAQTSFELREMLSGHTQLRGNAYGRIVFTAGGSVHAIIPLHPDRVHPVMSGDTVLYRYDRLEGGPQFLRASEVLHHRGLSFDGVQGLSQIAYHRNTIGIALTAEEYAGRFFGNSSMPAGVLKHPGGISDTALQHLRTTWKEKYGGKHNAGKVAILEEDMSFEAIGMTHQDSQFIETRRLQAEEICRIWKVPPPMIGILDRAQYNNTEQMELNFIKHTIRPWLIRKEQTYNSRLLTPTERRTYFIEHLVDGLLRGDQKTRGEYYRNQFMIGAMSRNEIRAAENLNPVADGDTMYVPLNMVPAHLAEQTFTKDDDPEPEPDPDEDGDDEDEEDDDDRANREKRLAYLAAAENRAVETRLRLRRAYRPLFVGAAERVVQAEAKALRELINASFGERAEGDFLEGSHEFYAGEFRESVRASFEPVVETYGVTVYRETTSELEEPGDPDDDTRKLIADYTDVLALRYISSSEGQLRSQLEQAEPGEAAEVLLARVDNWEAQRAERVADREVVQAGEAVSVWAYAALGVTYIRWRTVGKNCPLCNRMNGRTVEVKRPFLAAGSTLNADGVSSFKTRRAVAHPPLHAGCDCITVADR